MKAFEKHLRVLRNLRGAIALMTVIGPEYRKVFEALQTMDDEEVLSCVWAEELMQFADDTLTARRIATQARKATGFADKTSNRTEYLYSGTFVARHRKGACSWAYEQAITAEGLLPRMQSLIWGAPERQVALPVTNNLPEVVVKGKRFRQGIPDEEWEFYRSLDYLVSGGKVAWDLRSPAVAALIEALPSALDFRSYCHSLRAPLITKGFLPGVRVAVRTVTSYRAPSGSRYGNVRRLAEDTKRFAEACVDVGIQSHTDALGLQVCVLAAPTWAEFRVRATMDQYEAIVRLARWWDRTNRVTIKAGADGSGLYHPDAPEMANAIKEHGVSVFQHRTMAKLDNGQWILLKGLIWPNRNAVDAEGRPCISFDPDQVKGGPGKAWKKETFGDEMEPGSICATIDEAYVGLLAVRKKRATMGAGFEILENVSLDADNIRAVKDMTTAAMSRLRERGVNGLLAQAANRDLGLKALMQLVAHANEHGIEVNPMSVPMVAERLKDQLGRSLWPIATGGGVMGEQAYTIIDNGVPEGYIVWDGAAPGTRVAIWRFPCVLEQGLVVAEVMKPLHHHVNNGEVVPKTVFMNARDLTDKQQGDDDGDIVAISTDPKVVALFEQRRTDRVYMIEPAGQKLDLPMMIDGKLNPAAAAYVQSTPMGAVGAGTDVRSKMLAIGDEWAARAAAVFVQEAVDSAKNLVHYTNVEWACLPTSWEEIDGRWHLIVPEDGPDGLNPAKHPLGMDEGALVEHLYDWAAGKLEAAGINPKFQSVTGWNAQYSATDKVIEVDEETGYAQEHAVRIKKRIDVDTWRQTATAQRCDVKNLVHWASDEALRCWGSMEAEFQRTGDIAMPQLLTQLLAIAGVNVPVTETHVRVVKRYRGNDITNLSDLRAMLGITKFGRAIATAVSAQPETKYMLIERAYAELHLKLSDAFKEHGVAPFVNLWALEMSGEGNPNNALRAVVWEGSPIMGLLGIEATASCRFLDAPGRLDMIVGWAMNHASLPAEKALATMMWREPKMKAGTHEFECQNVNGEPQLAGDCPTCRKKLQDELVRRVRTTKARGEVGALSTLCTQINRGFTRTQPIAAGVAEEVANVVKRDEHYDAHAIQDDPADYGGAPWPG